MSLSSNAAPITPTKASLRLPTGRAIIALKRKFVGAVRRSNAARIPTFICIAAFLAIVPSARAQTTPSNPSEPTNPYASQNAQQLANILGIFQLVDSASPTNAQAPCSTAPTVEGLSKRQEILERTVAASFAVDGVLAELASERARLDELSTTLQARRDRAVNLNSMANLVTGTGVGIAVNAMQFSNSTATIGDGIGVASGAASTVLSLIGMRLQRGPQTRVGRIPNMLAPLFDKPGSLNAYYPRSVLAYLHSLPPGQGPESGSRLDQLIAEWQQAGRLGPTGTPQTEQQIARLTSSMGDNTKLSIDDISDRTAMLADVTGRVGLMKRDLAEILLSVVQGTKCAP